MPHPLSTWGPALDRDNEPQIATTADPPAEQDGASHWPSSGHNTAFPKPVNTLSHHGQALLRANAPTPPPSTPLRSLQSLQPPLPSPAARGSPLPKLTRSLIPAPTLSPRAHDDDDEEAKKADNAQQSAKANDLVPPPREVPPAPPLFVNGFFDDGEESSTEILKRLDIPSFAMSTGLPLLDAKLKLDCDRTGLAAGLAPGGALEIIGPTASCKTTLAIQCIANLRATAIVARHKQCSAQDTMEADEDLDQAVLVDTEGSIAPDMVRSGLLISIRSLLGPDKSLDCRNLLQDALSGIHLIRVTSLPELIATLRALTFPRPPYLLPPPHAISAILIDSASFHLRMPSERSESRPRRYATTLLACLQAQVTALNPRVRLIATNQMSLKMFTPTGELTNYKTAGSIARMVPQLDATSHSNSGDGATVNARWNGVAKSGSQPSHGDGNTARQDKGMGLLGLGAHRVVLFRAVHRSGPSASRFAQLIYRPAVQAAPDDSTPAATPVPLRAAEGSHRPDSSLQRKSADSSLTPNAQRPAAVRPGRQEPPRNARQQTLLESASSDWVPFAVVTSACAAGAVVVPA